MKVKLDENLGIRGAAVLTAAGIDHRYRSNSRVPFSIRSSIILLRNVWSSVSQSLPYVRSQSASGLPTKLSPVLGECDQRPQVFGRDTSSPPITCM